MKMRHSPVLISIIALLSLVTVSVIVFGKPQRSYSSTTKEGFVQELMNDMSSATNRQSLIDIYCRATANAQGFADPNAPGLFYDPGQSVFLGILCTHSTKRDDIKNFVKSSKPFDREDLEIPGCEWDSDMVGCDFSLFLPKLFAVAMNDLSKAKLSQLYGYQGGSADEAIKAFSDTYFGPGGSICGGKDSIYLGTTQGSAKEAPCLHPQTNTIVAQYFKQAEKLAKNTLYLDGQKLLASTGKECQQDSQQFLACGFSNNNQYAWDSFHNALYNELLFYNLLITMSKDRLQHPEFNKFRVYNDTTTESYQEIVRLAQEADLGGQATVYMEKSLQNMQVAFPIHIGLMAYYEDIIAFRKSLLRIYTPISQLYYKLRNVQQKQ